MGPVSKLHVGIPYQSCARYSKKLVDLGYRVCVVDQIEDDSDDEESESESFGMVCNMTGEQWEILPFPVIIDSGACASVMSTE